MSNDIRGFYCFARGVRFWEKTAGVDAPSATLTVGAMDLKDLAAVLAGILEPFESVVRWNTAVYKQWSSRVQEAQVRKQLSEDAGGFADTVMLEVDGVFTNASRFVPPLGTTHLRYLSSPDASLLMISRTRELDPKDVCAALSRWPNGADEATLIALRRESPDLVLARLVSHEDTVSVMQFFGSEDDLKGLEMKLAGRGIDCLRHRDQVAAWMESCISDLAWNALA